MAKRKNQFSEPHTRTVLDSIADGVFTVDLDFRVTFFNRAAEAITGVSREQALGQKCFDVFRADICQTKCVLRHSIETGREVINHKVNILNSEGDRVPVSTSTSVLRDAHGNVVGGVETFRDLSDLELLRRQLRDVYTFGDIISKNHRIRQLLDILPDIAASDSTVLIEGASGTGKELFAKAIHNAGPRRNGRFVAVNCSALPAPLLESELFGYRKGAFTDAKTDKPGRFALAEGGTLFLDEIADMAPVLQVKLLRVLQEREYEPLGATQPEKANVRIIAAANRSLGDQVARDEFRSDLFYRLNVVRVHLPPLAERREDIPLLVNHFVDQFNATTRKHIESVSPDALSALMQYDFPGNVRELENIIEHAFVLCRGSEIDSAHLPPEVRHHQAVDPIAAPPPEDTSLQSAEANAIANALQRNNGHRARTAADLGINPSTLWRKMKRYGIR